MFIERSREEVKTRSGSWKIDPFNATTLALRSQSSYPVIRPVGRNTETSSNSVLKTHPTVQTKVFASSLPY